MLPVNHNCTSYKFTYIGLQASPSQHKRVEFIQIFNLALNHWNRFLFLYATLSPGHGTTGFMLLREGDINDNINNSNICEFLCVWTVFTIYPCNMEVNTSIGSVQTGNSDGATGVIIKHKIEIRQSQKSNIEELN